ncbi:uncharacterized protein [Ptychodera flava]|uniref:uncharacterized protein n=1 Tax=Ptychodera flava TaxID=63121 RepID=UPI00396A6C00
MASRWFCSIVLLLSVLHVGNVVTLNIVTEPLHTGNRLSSTTIKCDYEVPSTNNKRVVKTWRMLSDKTGKEELVFSETDLKDGSGYGRFRDRVNIIGSKADLNIARLEVADTGDYTCEIDYYVLGESGEGETRLEIYSLVDNVDIIEFSPGADLVVPVGGTATLVCTSTLAAPAAKLIWFVENENLGQGEESITENADGTYNTRSTFVYEGKAEHHLKPLKCQSDQDPQLQGQYKNDYVRIISSGIWIKASSLVMFSCVLMSLVTSVLA